MNWLTANTQHAVEFFDYNTHSDVDSDGLSAFEEARLGTDKYNSDSDGDGLG